jgi:hypothetical protein
LEVPLSTSSFTSSFIKDALLKDGQHVDFLRKMGDVQIGANSLWCIKILSQNHPFLSFF